MKQTSMLFGIGASIKHISLINMLIQIHKLGVCILSYVKKPHGDYSKQRIQVFAEKILSHLNGRLIVQALTANSPNSALSKFSYLCHGNRATHTEIFSSISNNVEKYRSRFVFVNISPPGA